jgi:hypothetical protein
VAGGLQKVHQGKVVQQQLLRHTPHTCPTVCKQQTAARE